MMYDARQVANWFVRRFQADQRPVSIMSLLKLVYIAHGWHLETQGTALFPNRIEAWKYGPVIPDVYNAFRNQGVNVSSITPSVSYSEFDNNDAELLQQVYDIYGSLDAFQLSELTHVPNGPWDLATKAGGNYAPIHNDLIKQHYVAKRAEANRQASN